jgi:hypothetical protein
VSVTPDDLRIRLGFLSDDWTAADDLRAEAVLESARAVILTFADPTVVAQAEQDNNEAKLAAVDQATLIYATPLFANPERVLQRRQGSDYSVSFADGSDAANGLKEALAILDAADLRPGGDAFAVDTVPQDVLSPIDLWIPISEGGSM